MRDVAYWPRTFLDEIEQARVGSSPVLWALGGPSFLYRTSRTSIWIDPYLGGTPDDAVADAYRACAIPVKPDEIRTADIVISTHDHVDHCHEGTVMPILANTDERFCVAPATSAKLMREWGVAPERLEEVGPGESFRFTETSRSPFTAPRTPASRVRSPMSSTPAGRGSSCPAIQPALLRLQRLDPVALTFRFSPSVGRGTWTRTRVLAAARDLSPGTLFSPFHWEFWRNHTGDIVRLVQLHQQERLPFELKVCSSAIPSR